MNTSTVSEQQAIKLGLDISKERIEKVIQKALDSDKGLRLTLNTIGSVHSNSRNSIKGTFHCTKEIEGRICFAVDLNGGGVGSYIAVDEKDTESFFAWILSVEAETNKKTVPELLARFDCNYCC